MATSPIDISAGLVPKPASAGSIDISAGLVPRTAAQPAPEAAAQPSAPQEGFWHSLGAQLGLTPEAAEAMRQHVLAHPVEAGLEALVGGPAWQLAKGVYQGGKRSVGELEQAGESLGSGNAPAAAVHAITAVPIVGPAINKGADQYNEGNIAGEVGTVLGAAAQAAPLVTGAADLVPGRPTVPTPSIVAPVKRFITGDVNAPMAGTDLTPAARYASMKAMGVQPNAAEATNSTPLNMAERVNQNSLTSQSTYANARAANLAALNRFTNETLDSMSPLRGDAGSAAVHQQLGELQAGDVAALDRATARALDKMSPLGQEGGGAAVQQGLLNSHADLKAAATEAYGDLDTQVGDQPLPGAAGLREQAQAILDANAPYYKLHPELEPTKAMSIVRDLADAKAPAKPGPAVISGFGPAPAAPEVAPPRVPTYSELHRLRSDLLDFNNTNPDLVKNQANGWISQLAGAVDKAITSGEGALNPEQLGTFRNANEAWKFMKDTYDNPSHPFYQAVRNPSPSTLVNGTSGIARTPEMATTLQGVLGPKGMGPVQRGLAEKLLGTAKDGGYDYNSFARRWNQLPEDYRNALFAQDQQQQLEGIANKGSAMHTNPLYQAIGRQAPSALVDSLPQTPETVAALKGALGEKGLGPVQRAAAGNLLKTTKEGGYNFKTFQGLWNRLPQGYRDALFTPEQQQRLADIGNAGTVLHEDLNPSGTAKLGQGQAEMLEGGSAIGAAGTGHPGALIGTGTYHAVQYALGRLMNAPKFVDWLMRDEGRGPVASAAPGSFGDASRMWKSGTLPIAENAPKQEVDPHTGPDGQPNFYSDEYLAAKARLDAGRQ